LGQDPFRGCLATCPAHRSAAACATLMMLRGYFSRWSTSMLLRQCTIPSSLADPTMARNTAFSKLASFRMHFSERTQASHPYLQHHRPDDTPVDDQFGCQRHLP
jgi:hypothetical protein